METCLHERGRPAGDGPWNEGIERRGIPLSRGEFQEGLRDGVRPEPGPAARAGLGWGLGPGRPGVILLGMLFGLFAGMGVMTSATAITWTGAGDGRSWSQAANWDAQRVPGPADEVTLPAGFATVEHLRGSTQIRRLTTKGGFWLKGGTLSLTDGASVIGGGFTLGDDATLEAVGLAVEVVIDGSPVELSGSLRAEEGALVRLVSVGRIRGRSPDWWADGPGTRIDARSVTNVVPETNERFAMLVRNEARLDLSGVSELRGPVSPRATTGGVIDLSGARGRWTTEGFYYEAEIAASEGGQLLMGGVNALDRVVVSLDGTDGLPMKAWTAFTRSRLLLSEREVLWGGVTRIDDSDIRLEEGAVLRLPAVGEVRGDLPEWRVEGQGTLIDARAVTNIALGKNGRFPIEARNQGRVDLSGVAMLRGPVSPKVWSDGVIDLSKVKGRWTTEGFYYEANLSAMTGGRLELPGVDALDRMSVALDATGEIPMRQWTSFTRGLLELTGREVTWGAVSSIDDSELRLEEGAVLRLPAVVEVRGNSPSWRVEGQGTLLEAPFVSNIALGTNGRFPIEARNQGRVDLSGLRSLRAPVTLKAWSAGVIDLSGLSGLWRTQGFYYTGEIFVSGEGWVRAPGLDGVDRVDVSVEELGRVDSAGWEVLRNADVDVSGFGAVLALGRLRDQTGTQFRTSDGGVITFAAVPRIVTNPVGRKVRPGESWVLVVEAVGEAPLSYQWYKNGQPLPGQVSASLRLNDVRVADAGEYVVQVRNAAGLTASQPAIVGLDLPEWPFGDAFARRGLVRAKEGVGIGSNLGASLDAGEPIHANKQGGRSIWLTWRAPETGVATFDTLGSGFDTLLAVYRGATLASLSSNLVTADDDGGGFFASRVVFNALAGVEYEIAVDGYAGAGGDVVLSWSLDPASPPLPVIQQQPADVFASEGSRVRFSVVAGPGTVTYRWFKNGVEIPGATASVLELVDVRAGDAATYRVEVRAPGGGRLLSQDATLEIADRGDNSAGASVDKLADLFLDDEGGVARGLLSLRPRSAGGVGVGLPGGQWTDNSESTRSPDDPVVCDVATSATRWFRLRLNVPAVDPFVLHTEGSEIPAFLAVFTNRTALTLLACDAAAMPTKPAAKVTFAARSGVDYLVLVDGVDGATGRIRLNWVLEEVPVPSQRPDLKFEGGRFSIRMFPLPGTYDWQVGGALSSFATLFRTNLTVGDFRYIDPDPPSAAAKFFRLKPAP